MPRTAIAVQVAGPNGLALDDITFSAADATNDHEFVNSGREILLMKNDSGGALTADAKSVIDEHARLGDQTLTAAAANISMAGPFSPAVWNQRAAADAGKVFVDLTVDTSLTFAVIQLT